MNRRLRQLGMGCLLAVAVSAPAGAPAVRASTPGTWSVTASMLAGRQYHTATRLPNGKILVAGGFDDQGCGCDLATAELYDPTTGTWTFTGSMHTARAYHTAALLHSGKVLVLGGWVYNGGYALSSAELYDPTTGTWTATSSMPTVRFYNTMTTLLGGKILVAGGCINSECFGNANTAVLYDPATATWRPVRPMLAQRVNHTATLLPNGEVLVAGGCLTTPCTTSELYDPRTGTWSATGSMVDALAYHTATLLRNGQVLVAGGLNGYNFDLPTADAELFDPGTNTWTQTGSLSVERAYQSAVLLPSGQVLVAAGFNDTTGQLASAELYDPSTATWTTTGSLHTPRDFQTMTLLPKGNVLVAGGFDYPPGTLSSAEVYTSS